jgi:hypothetical protein
MAYFKNLPSLFYSTSLGVKNFKLVTNILAKATFIDNILDNSNMYYPYDVKDGEKPEDIANKLYKDPQYHWIILISNKITDPQYDWVLSQAQFADYINAKYSSLKFNLKSTETYPTAYTVGEQVFQGSTIDKSSCQATVVSSNTVNKTLTINFANEVFANAANVTGATSNITHTIVASTINNDGFNWASNTTSHYKVTEVSYNNYDQVRTTKTYKVSAKDYNFSTDTVTNRNTNTSSSTSYLLNDGSTLTVQTTVAPVTHYDYEVELNEAKRRIKLVKPEYISRINAELIRLMRT